MVNSSLSYFRDNPNLGDGNIGERQVQLGIHDFRDNPNLGDGNYSLRRTLYKKHLQILEITPT